MNQTEHLLVCLLEECAEVQQAVSKALRFSLDDRHPDRKETNKEDIARECCDLIAVIELLEEQQIIPKIRSDIEIEKKKQKVNKYIQYAKEQGTII